MNYKQIFNRLLKKVYTSNKQFIPPPKLSVSEWAEKYRIKSTESSATGGRWKNLPYQVAIQDAFTDPTVEEIVFVSSAQVGKTEVLLNILGYIAHYLPAGTLIVFPTLDDSKIFSATRLSPLFRDCKPLKGLIAKNKTKSSKNSTYFKEFPGGFIRLVGSGSPSSLASMPLPFVLADEIDKYIKTLNEGDPLSLALTRSKMQFNRKAFISSTPTTSDASRIHKLWLNSDMRRFWIPCPHCKELFLLRFENLHWDSYKDKDGVTIHKPETAYMLCSNPDCGCVITDAQKNVAVKSGVWKAEQPFYGRAGFHLNEFYSPFRTFAQISSDFIKKKDSPDTLQEFMNSVLGKVWEVDFEQINSNDLYNRRENYYKIDSRKEVERYLPMRGGMLTAGIDVHPDRIEASVWLWGVGDEAWAIEHLVFHGNIHKPKVWDKLNILLNKRYMHESGNELVIQCAAVDTGYATDRGYWFVNGRKWPAVAIKGSSVSGSSLVRSSESTPDKLAKGTKLYNVGTDTAKNTLFQRSFITSPGPGCLHWNQNFDKNYFKQFTSEKHVTRRKMGREYKVWELPSGARNEALDCAVYALAARTIVGIADLTPIVNSLNPERKTGNDKVVNKKNQEGDDQFVPDWLRMERP